MRKSLQHQALALFSSKALSSATRTRAGRTIFNTAYWYYKDWVEVPGSDALRQYLPAGTWAIDVGANIGYFTTKFAKWVSADGKVIAVEPEPGNIEQLIHRLSRSQLRSMVEVVPAACGARTGIVRLKVTPEHPGNHSIASDGDGDIEVQSVTIDALVADAGNPDIGLIKIDTQGAEMLVLDGAAATIARCRPNMLVEVDDQGLGNFGANAGQLLQRLQDMGYEFATISRKGVAPGDKAALLRQLSARQGAYLDVLCVADRTGVSGPLRRG